MYQHVPTSVGVIQRTMTQSLDLMLFPTSVGVIRRKLSKSPKDNNIPHFRGARQAFGPAFLFHA